MTKWTDYVKRKANELGLSYGCAMTDRRVKEGYKQIQSPKAKKAKKAKQRQRSPSTSMSTSLEISSPNAKKAKQRSPSTSFEVSSPKAKKAKQRSASSSLSTSFEISSPKAKKAKQRSPSTSPKNDSIKKTLKKIMEMSPIKTPEFIKKQRLGRTKRPVRKDTEGFEDVDEFFDQFESS